MKKRAVVVPLGLLALAALSACTGKEAAATPTPAAPKATQVIGSATAAGSGASAAASANSAKFPLQTRSVSMPILGAIPNSPPRATPTPLPAGVTPTPPPPAATPGAPQKKQIIFYVDTVTSGPGESLLNVDPSVSCAQTNMFLRGMHVVFRATAYDNTGTELQTGNVDSFVLHVGGKDITMRYGRHATGTPGEGWFWTGAWDIPGDFPLGAVNFSMDAKTKSGLSGTFKQDFFTTGTAEESRLAVVG